MDNRRICFINASTGKVAEEVISPSLRSLFLGGRGINMCLLYRHTTARTRPLDPENPLIIGAGLLSGTAAPCSSRCSVSGKSPETDLLGDSNIGGYFSAYLRKTAYDHVLITGQAESPVYILIEDDRATIRDASHLWGTDTLEAARVLESEHGPESQSLVIGPAGENLVSFATVRHGRKHTAGRTGMGCLMGSKRVKAVVACGNRDPQPAQPDAMKACARRLHGILKNTRTTEVLNQYGTPFLFDLHNWIGILRTLNGQKNLFKEGRGLHSIQLKKHVVGTSGCFACPIKCTHSYKPHEEAGVTLDGMEYGVLSSIGSVCGIADLKAIFSINDLLNRYGLDASSVGNIIAWAIELFQRGVLTEKDTSGLCLDWGNVEIVAELIEQIVARQGFGSLLADGARRAAEHFGDDAGRYMVWSKYLPQSDSVDLRAHRGFALGVATSTRGADHLRSRPTIEALHLPEDELHRFYGASVSGDPTSYEGKARMVWWSEIEYALGDALGICRFAQRFNSTDHLGLEDFAELISAATDMKLSSDELVCIGERIVTLERMFLKREGVGRESDTLPDRYFDEPMPLGQYKGERLDRDAFNRMLDEYYQLHAWDVLTGTPENDAAARLGMEKALLSSMTE